MVTQETKFQKLYKGCEEAIRTMNMPRAERAMKRQFAAAIDALYGAVDQAELEISQMESLVASPTSFNMDALMGCLTIVKKANEQREALEGKYADLFGEEYISAV